MSRTWTALRPPSLFRPPSTPQSSSHVFHIVITTRKTFSTDMFFVLVTKTRRSGREIQQSARRQEGGKPIFPSSTVAIFVASVWLTRSLRCQWGLCPPDNETRPTYDGVRLTALSCDGFTLTAVPCDGVTLTAAHVFAVSLHDAESTFFWCHMSTISSVLSLTINLFTVNQNYFFIRSTHLHWLTTSYLSTNE